MEEKAIITGGHGAASAKDIIAAGVSKLSGSGVVAVVGIIGLTLVGSIVAVCASGSEVSIGCGLFEIRQPHSSNDL